MIPAGIVCLSLPAIIISMTYIKAFHFPHSKILTQSSSQQPFLGSTGPFYLRSLCCFSRCWILRHQKWYSSSLILWKLVSPEKRSSEDIRKAYTVDQEAASPFPGKEHIVPHILAQHSWPIVSLFEDCQWSVNLSALPKNPRLARRRQGMTQISSWHLSLHLMG